MLWKSALKGKRHETRCRSVSSSMYFACGFCNSSWHCAALWCVFLAAVSCVHFVYTKNIRSTDIAVTSHRPGLHLQSPVPVVGRFEAHDRYFSVVSTTFRGDESTFRGYCLIFRRPEFPSDNRTHTRYHSIETCGIDGLTFDTTPSAVNLHHPEEKGFPMNAGLGGPPLVAPPVPHGSRTSLTSLRIRFSDHQWIPRSRLPSS